MKIFEFLGKAKMKIKFFAIILITGFVLGSFTISNTAFASEDMGKLIPSDAKLPPISPPGLEREGMTRVISTITAEKGVSDIKQKGCTIIHKLNQATSFFCPTQIVDALDDVRPVKIYETHDLWQVEQIQADRVWNELGYDGTGVKVAVLDTGVQINHDELDPPGRGYSEISLTADFTGEGGSHLDYNGHGTHVSGIITGNGLYTLQDTANKATGVTDFKSPNLIVGKVCGSQYCPEDAILAGIEWAKNQGADVINMSLGGGLDDRPDCDTNPDPTKDPDPIVDAVNNVTSPISAGGSDIVVVISSGNDGDKNKVSYPGCASGAIAVGAVDINDNDASFSNAGPAMDIVAPGVNTLSSVSCNVSPIYSCASTWYSYKSGTSMSAPHVTGVVALMLDKNPNLTVQQVKDYLYDNTISVGPNDGNGRVDAYAAVNAVPNPNPLTDDDFDGYMSNVDCDDNNPAINPGETEIPYDGIDQDCSGSDLTDVDGDTYDGGTGSDCDDTNDTIYPGATETYYDGIDQDCDGSDAVDFDADGSPSTAATGGTPDCDDTNDTIYPGAPETLDDGIDQDCDGSDATSGATSDIFVGDLMGSVSGKKWKDYDVTITVSYDSEASNGNNITVYGKWSDGPSTTCNTVSGTCTVTLNVKSDTMTFTVTNLSGTNMIYVAGQNVETSIILPEVDGGSGGGGSGGGGSGGGGSGGEWDCVNKYNAKKCPDTQPPE
jgi:subtilisin family serine protease